MKSNDKNTNKVKNCYEKGTYKDKHSRKPRDKKRETKTEFTEKGTHNHPSWYAANPQLLKDVASLPFSNMLGNEVINISDLLKYTTEGGFSRYANSDHAHIEEISVPGVMAIYLEPTLGGGDLATDAPTVAARNLYAFIRHANSGSANYEAPDLEMYILARISAEAWLNSVERAYGTMLSYSTRNRYYAQTVVRAMGFNYSDMLANMVNVRAYINQAKARLNTMKIPSGFPLRDRWNYLTTNIFLDDQSAKPQTYIPVFQTYMQFDGYGSETGTQLIYTAPSEGADASGITFQDIVAFTEQLLDPMLSEEDCGIMSGDIIKAYGDSLASLSLTTENYMAVPVFDESFLTQVHNLIIIPNGPITSTTQKDGVIIDSHTTADSVLPVFNSFILNSFKDDVTPEESMVMTRLVNFVSYVDGNYVIRKCGTEIVRGVRIYGRPTNNASDPYVFNLSSNVLDYGSATSQESIEGTLAITCFNYHPIIYGVYYDTAGQTQLLFGLTGDLDNFTVVSQDVVERMNTIAVLSELNISSKTTLQ